MKIRFYSILLIFFSIYTSVTSLAQKIYPQKLEVLEYCVGTDIQVPFKLDGKFNPDNQFNLEISDSAGIFTYHKVIGTITSAVADTIKCNLSISAYLPSSSKYKLRIVSTSPATISQPMPGTIKLKNAPDYHRNIYVENVINATKLTSTCDTINALFEFSCYNIKGKPSKVKWTSSSGNPITIKEITDTSSNMIINLGSSFNKSTYTDLVGVSFSNECGFSNTTAFQIIRDDFRPYFDTIFYKYQKIDTACEGILDTLMLGQTSLGTYVFSDFQYNNADNNPNNSNRHKQIYFIKPGIDTLTIDTVTNERLFPKTLWKLPEGMRITKNLYRNGVKVQFSVGPKSGIIEVDLKNECGFTARKPLKIEMRVIPKPNPIETIVGDTLLCSNITAHLFSIKLDTLVSKYNWKLNYPNQILSESRNGTKVEIKAFQNGTISVSGENKCGVSANMSKVFQIDSLPLPPITVPQYSQICDGNIDNVSNINALSTESGSSKVKFRWQLPIDVTQVTNNLDGSMIGIKVLPTTKNTEIKVFSQNYCGESVMSVNHKIKVYKSSEKPKIKLSSSNDSICEGQEINFLANVSSTSDIVDYEWKFDNTIVNLNGDSTFSTSSINEKTLVKVKVSSLLYCDLQSNIVSLTLSDSILINTKPLPIMPYALLGNDNICLDDSMQIYEVSGDSIQTYVWQIPNIYDGNSDSSTITLIPAKLGVGSLRVYSKNECGESLPISIDIQINSCKNLYIPNVFSCNSEAGWNIEGLDDYPKATIKVYNRWGSLIFESIGYKTPWDGSIQNTPVSLGTYYYILEFGSTNKKPITGSVTIYK